MTDQTKVKRKGNGLPATHWQTVALKSGLYGADVYSTRAYMRALKAALLKLEPTTTAPAPQTEPAPSDSEST
jgi:hypothetical protein